MTQITAFPDGRATRIVQGLDAIKAEQIRLQDMADAEQVGYDKGLKQGHFEGAWWTVVAMLGMWALSRAIYAADALDALRAGQ